MGLKISVNIDADKIMGRLKERGSKAIFAVAQQVLKDSNYYAPQKTGVLHRSGIIHTTGTKAVVEWGVPYAKRLYYGDRFNFSKEKNPMAQSRWFDKAKEMKMNEWAAIAQRYF